MDPDILKRIQRLHVALGRVVEHDLSRFPARIVEDSRGRLIAQNFSGGRSEADLSETLHGLINNIASFHDHLQKWGDQNGVNRESIHNFLKDSFDFCVVRDLWNCEKHGEYQSGNKGWSKKAPRLRNVRCTLKLKTRPAQNSTVGVTMAKDGSPLKFGDGHACVVITGEVVDRCGNCLGGADNFIEKALKVCECALRRFRVTNN